MQAGKIIRCTAMSRADTRAILLRNAIADLRAFKAKYAALTELAKVFEAIGEMTDI